MAEGADPFGLGQKIVDSLEDPAALVLLMVAAVLCTALIVLWRRLEQAWQREQDLQQRIHELMEERLEEAKQGTAIFQQATTMLHAMNRRRGDIAPGLNEPAVTFEPGPEPSERNEFSPTTILARYRAAMTQARNVIAEMHGTTLEHEKITTEDQTPFPPFAGSVIPP